MSALVSILMTAYNRQEYIAQAIESVLVSSYKNLELIIVDDGSKDDTVKIARRFAATDERVRVYENEVNLGDYPNRNHASTYARGEFIMYVDSDDMLLSDALEQLVTLMQAHPACGMGMYWLHGKGEPFVLEPAAAIRQHFYERSFLIVGPGGTIMRRDFFEQIGKYPVEYGPANDMYFNLKAAAATPLLMIPFEFIFYRRHEGQQINNNYNYLYNNYRYLRDALNELDLPLTADQTAWLQKKNKRRFVINLASYLARTRDVKKTKAAMKLAGFSWRDIREGIFHT